ncbi:MAG: NAD-binding protein [Sulfolobaceae archaeon]
MKQSRTVVIGAGNAGSVVANSLSKRGLSVTVIEPSGIPFIPAWAS